jgi:hypothetical protein
MNVNIPPQKLGDSSSGPQNGNSNCCIDFENSQEAADID